MLLLNFQVVLTKFMKHWGIFGHIEKQEHNTLRLRATASKKSFPLGALLPKSRFGSTGQTITKT